MMAPAASTGFEYHEQIQVNCQFFSKRQAQIQIITRKDGSQFGATVLRIAHGKREELFSATGSSPRDAMYELYLKSMEATQNHYTTSGVAFNEQADDDTSSISDGEISFTVGMNDNASDSQSSSEDDSASDQSNSKSKKSRTRGRKARRGAQKTASRGRSRSSSVSSATDRSQSRSRSRSRSPNTTVFRPRRTNAVVLPPPRPIYVNRPPHRLSSASVPNFTAARTTSPPVGVRPAALPIRMATPPGTQLWPGQAGAPTQATQPAVYKLRDVRLHINWFNHGTQNLLNKAPASLRHMQDMAVNYVRRNTFCFQKVTPPDTSPAKLWALRATVKRAYIDGECYDMSCYNGDDLTKLMDLASASDNIPRFDIDVDSLPPGVRRVSPPPPPS